MPCEALFRFLLIFENGCAIVSGHHNPGAKREKVES
jgi:hypothetical protein